MKNQQEMRIESPNEKKTFLPFLSASQIFSFLEKEDDLCEEEEKSNLYP